MTQILNTWILTWLECGFIPFFCIKNFYKCCFTRISAMFYMYEWIIDVCPQFFVSVQDMTQLKWYDLEIYFSCAVVHLITNTWNPALECQILPWSNRNVRCVRWILYVSWVCSVFLVLQLVCCEEVPHGVWHLLSQLILWILKVPADIHLLLRQTERQR